MNSKAADRPDLSPFSKELKSLRQAKGLTQAAVAALARVSTGYVGLLETGERGSKPSYDIVRRFAKALSLDVEESERLMRAAGHLGPSESLWQPGEDWTLEEAIRRDPRLDNNQKQILLGVVEQFVRGGVTSRGSTPQTT